MQLNHLLLLVQRNHSCFPPNDCARVIFLQKWLSFQLRWWLSFKLTYTPLPIFILSVLSSLPKARLSKNKIFIVFRFSSVTDKTTQNKKDTREVSRIFYSAIAPDC
ncbi:hypothetical protein DD607_04985 [Salmonella sp. 3DZ2-4SM]|nr:hypothetical protein DD607_04985 [Salmonella sp. 3DZ2-4SM]